MLQQRSRIVIGVFATACLLLFLKYHFGINLFTSRSPPTSPALRGPFFASDVLRWNVRVTAPPPYQDPVFLKDCRMDMERRRNMFHLLKYWMKVAAKHNITWFLSCGTSLGSLRHRDMIPWDLDVDTSVMEADEATIRRIAVKKHRTMDVNQTNLVVRYSDFCPVDYWPRKTCQDKIVYTFSDVCSFCGPLARVLGRDSHLELYRVRLHSSSDGVRLLDEGFDAQPENMFRVKDFFPLEPCYFMGLQLLCPKKNKAILEQYYKHIGPLKICDHGRWVDVHWMKTPEKQ